VHCQGLLSLGLVMGICSLAWRLLYNVGGSVQEGSELPTA
jgi:hypothetical protein